MVKIKIISNPYEQTICFETVDNNHTCHAIKETGYRGDLISHNYKNCFFPFKVKEILDLVMADFGSPTDHLELVFQGTSDEWRELELIVKQNHYTNVTLSRSHLYLENARDILKQIILVFQKLSPLLAQNLGDAPMIKRELEKFSEASGEEIPLYVVGNFSSGKSTFINALIGHEVLPSSAKPTTAKIYKIKDSLYNDRASISFSLDNQLVSIQLRDGDYKLQVPDSDDVLLTNIKEILQKNRDLSIQRLMSELLLAINKAANKNGGQIMSDLIQVELPFAEDGVLKRHASRFVILDTPGSDSANNREHFRVLKNALEGLSNGLPIVVSEFESLDRTNADALANEITSLEELDQRFTMIIVNKADSTKLHDYSEEDVLNTAIPQKLYASGIYFLSSLMGLGSKINEQFTDPYSSEIFMDQKRKYLEKDSTYYKQLYQYNILPPQIKTRYAQESSDSPNLLLANSGLLEVERAINDFVTVYSSYNKCQQSSLFLNKMLQMTSDSILKKKEEKESYKKEALSQLENEKQVLIKEMNSESNQLKQKQLQNHAPHLRTIANKFFKSVKLDDLKLRNKELERQAFEIKKITELEKKKAESWDKIFSDAVDNGSQFDIRDWGNNFKLFGKTLNDFTSDVSDYIKSDNMHKSAIDKAENMASEELIKEVKEDFIIQLKMAKEGIENSSQDYWQSKSEEFKICLSKVVTESDALSLEKREEIQEIIIKYKDLTFNDRAERIFDPAKLKYGFLWLYDKINLEKVSTSYDKELVDEIKRIRADISLSHSNSYEKWSQELVGTIEKNIVDFNPKLRLKSEMIASFEKEIEDLETTKTKIMAYADEVKALMNWKSES